MVGRYVSHELCVKCEDGCIKYKVKSALASASGDGALGQRLRHCDAAFCDALYSSIVQHTIRYLHGADAQPVEEELACARAGGAGAGALAFGAEERVQEGLLRRAAVPP
jgi:hypothetical protein